MSVAITMDHECIDCDRIDCTRAFNDLAAQIGEDQSDYIHAQHCEYEDCHEIYIRGKNGADCPECGIRACDQCQQTKMTNDVDFDSICNECVGAYAGVGADANYTSTR